MKEFEQIRFHCIFVLYFDCEVKMSAESICQFWQELSIVRNCSVSGNLKQKKDKDIRFREKLGSPELRNKLNNEDIERFGFDYYRSKQARDTTFHLDMFASFDTDNRWEGHQLPASLELSISCDWVECMGQDVAIKLWKDVLAIMMVYKPIYGLIDVSPTEDALGGCVYSSVGYMNSPLHRFVERGNWMYSASKRKDRVRGLYWGNYFGEAILNKLGGKTEFIEQYGEAIRLRDSSSSALIWDFESGVFTSLCLEPFGCTPGDNLNTFANANLRWMIQYLGPRGILNPW